MALEIYKYKLIYHFFISFGCVFHFSTCLEFACVHIGSAALCCITVVTQTHICENIGSFLGSFTVVTLCVTHKHSTFPECYCDSRVVICNR